MPPTKPKIPATLLMLSIAILSGCGLTDRDSARKPVSKGREKSTETAAVIPATALDVVQVHRTNAALADEKYTDKRAAVTGRMIRITGTAIVHSDGAKGSVYGLEMASGEATPTTYLTFRFDDGDRQELAKLKENQNLTIEGQCKGWSPVNKDGLASIYFWECKIISAGK